MFPIEQTLDHAGPICASTRDVALLLGVIAGRDPLDPRQAECETHDYLAALGKGVKGLKLAVVKEGFGRPESEAAVDEKVRAAAERFRQLGAIVSEVSIPMHEDGIAIWTAIAAEGAAELMIKGNATGSNWLGHYPTGLPMPSPRPGMPGPRRSPIRSSWCCSPASTCTASTMATITPRRRTCAGCCARPMTRCSPPTICC
jgi:Asp-tRNA(Asn)/Glu-tRNA(Gln) amidotransferase A subunit family amidase